MRGKVVAIVVTALALVINLLAALLREQPFRLLCEKLESTWQLPEE